MAESQGVAQKLKAEKLLKKADEIIQDLDDMLSRLRDVPEGPGFFSAFYIYPRGAALASVHLLQLECCPRLT